ncbi:hypothetical protein ILYODFUR_036971 [Ilyodon furcidens]|uniref:Uncharacterized protein n=1 Tax=Ilyodon furcidens TaxID=33524 RepID=A0ABV0TFK8_9TELE
MEAGSINKASPNGSADKTGHSDEEPPEKATVLQKDGGPRAVYQAVPQQVSLQINSAVIGSVWLSSLSKLPQF